MQERPHPDFSDLEESLDAPAPLADATPSDFLTASAEYAAHGPTKTCPRCRGTGRFYSRYTGRDVGPCNPCGGTGRVKAGYRPRGALKMDAESVARRERSRQRRAETKAADARDLRAAIERWQAEHAAEYAWLVRNSGHNEFATSLLSGLAHYGSLTDNQLAAVSRAVARAEARKAPVPGLDLRHVPTGLYAVPGGDTRLKVRIDNVTEGKWAGWVFVKDGAEYGHGSRYGAQRPGDAYRGKIEQELAIIARDPKAASAAYGHLVGRCGICNRKLEDEESVARGIGPICAGRLGW